MTISVGDFVQLAVLPPWVSSLPEDSQAVFRHCVGRSFRVDEIDPAGLLVLDVAAEIDPKFGGFMNDIRVEPVFVRACRPPNSTVSWLARLGGWVTSREIMIAPAFAVMLMVVVLFVLKTCR